jgi:hypothetical protein
MQHHCRTCGKLFCAQCTCFIAGPKGKRVRVCQLCMKNTASHTSACESSGSSGSASTTPTLPPPPSSATSSSPSCSAPSLSSSSSVSTSAWAGSSSTPSIKKLHSATELRVNQTATATATSNANGNANGANGNARRSSTSLPRTRTRSASSGLVVPAVIAAFPTTTHDKLSCVSEWDIILERLAANDESLSKLLFSKSGVWCAIGLTYGVV